MYETNKTDMKKLKRTGATTLTLPFPPPYVWDMNRLSPHFHHPQQPDKQSLVIDTDNIDNHDHRCQEPRPEDQDFQEIGLAGESNIESKRCEWDFTLSAVVSSTGTPTAAAAAASDTLGVIEFDPSGTLMATGGIARKIRIYNFDSLLLSSSSCRETGVDGTAVILDHARAYDYYICTPAKLSSLRWKPGSGGRVIGSGDYDGVVTEYDLERRVPIFERDEHRGRRVWSVDYTRWDPTVGASGSDDGTVQVWDTRCEQGTCVAELRPSGSAGSPVCSVEFNPFGGSLVAVGCADRRAYCYDVRKLVDPVQVFDGHAKTVTYVKFLDFQTVVSASTDGCLKQWNVEDARVVRTYRGHVNSRSFVGLSVFSGGGLLGCGSESNQVFVYDKRWGEPIWVHSFHQFGTSGGRGGGFVSSVSWQQLGDDKCTLVAGGSDGVLQVFTGERTSLSLSSSSSSSSFSS